MSATRTFASIEEAIEDIRAGRMVVVVDDVHLPAGVQAAGCTFATIREGAVDRETDFGHAIGLHQSHAKALLEFVVRSRVVHARDLMILVERPGRQCLEHGRHRGQGLCHGSLAGAGLLPVARGTELRRYDHMATDQECWYQSQPCRHAVKKGKGGVERVVGG